MSRFSTKYRQAIGLMAYQWRGQS